MIIQRGIILLVVLMAFYYATVFAHLFGMQVFKKPEIKIGLALIPFYYWIKGIIVK